MVVAVAGLLISTAGGIACFNLDHALSSQRHDLSEARKQLLAMDQALSSQRHGLSEARERLAAVIDKFADAQKNNQTLNQQLTEIQGKLRDREAVSNTHFPQFQAGIFPGAAPGVPAAVSVEGKLLADGKHWERTPGQIGIGTYVQDTLDGRMGQPEGRGSIGKVMAVSAGTGPPCATVDFGRGCTIGIMFSELSPIRFVGSDMR
jgi:hypothetical protein